MRTRIKFCGMTRAEDISHAARLGVDAIGLIFTHHSKRCVNLEQARQLRQVVPPFVDTVALFMDDDPALVNEVIAAIKPQYLQFHGSESSAYCAAFNRPYLKAIAMQSVTDIAAHMAEYPHASGFLLDAHAAGEPGGQGTTFDWTRVPPALRQQIILAGGLNGDNIRQAIQQVRPWAVDVSSGIESAPGIKDTVKMKAITEIVHSL